MKGKRVVVTGATSGIGTETALALAGMGAEVCVVGRSRTKVEATVEAISRATGAPVLWQVADLSLASECRRVAGAILAQWDRLDVLVNNAGAINMKRLVTAEGLEMTFALNHLGYFVLTQELMPALERAGRARIVSVASEAHRGQRVDFGDLQLERGYAAFKAYGRSKLMNVLWTRELARRVRDRGITANCVQPGVVATGFMSAHGPWGVAMKIARPLLLTPKQGAATSIYCASAPEVGETTGAYFSRSRVVQPSATARDDALARRLWEETERVLAGLGSAVAA